ncbi:MAG: adenylate/guanylate cyclase domain-containing protein [Bacteroidales bacterium]
MNNLSFYSGKQDKKANKPPRYYSLRVYLFSMLLYLMLVLPLLLVLTAKEISNLWHQKTEELKKTGEPTDTVLTFKFGNSPTAIDKQDETTASNDILDEERTGFDTQTPGINLSNKDNTKDNSNQADNQDVLLTKKKTRINSIDISATIKTFILTLLVGFLFNLPFRMYFSKKRKGKRITKAHHNFVRRYIIPSPIINAVILGVGFLVINTYSFIDYYANNENFENFKYLNNYIYISVIASILTVMFVYFWEKHRMHIKYVEHIFTPNELKKNIFRYRIGKIKSRLWISSIMTTILPLSIVLFYLYVSATIIDKNSFSHYSPEQLKMISGENIFTDLDSSLIYYSAQDAYLMIFGVAVGIITSFIYIFFFLNWTTKDIIIPVSSLLNQVQRTGRGNLDSYGTVRTNDEIGELTQGFNDMTDKLNEYFQNIKRVNEANSRFVPNEFLRFLNKKSIDEINLGDQVQKEMTVMFSDIREFTNISETMTPKENFDFLNNYLGIMEPVIHKHHGFIDKYIGDAIMALFPDNIDQALDTAIEMRYKLIEFNTILKQYGRKSIDSGVGIHTGNLMLGIVGGEKRMDGTVISDAVNLSSRLESLTKGYGASIILSEESVNKIQNRDKYLLRFIDQVKVKGKTNAVRIFELINGESKEQYKLKERTKDKLSNGIKLYHNRQFEEALIVFTELHSINKQDKVFSIYINRCKKYLEFGSPEKWDGIESLDSK